MRAFPNPLLKCTMWLSLASASAITSLAATTTETMPTRGLVPAGSYSLSQIETINVVNGNVFYQIPLASLPPGRGGFSAGVKLTYNSQIYDITPAWGTSPSSGPTVIDYLRTSLSGGWQYGYTYSLLLEGRVNPVANGNGCINDPNDGTVWELTSKVYRLSLISPDGSHHTLHLYRDTPTANGSTYSYWDLNGDGYYAVAPNGSSACSPEVPAATGDMTYHTSDGSYLKVVVADNGEPNWANRPWTVYFPDGGRVTGYGYQTTALIDRNGNTITVQNLLDNTADPNYEVPVTVLTDSLGRTIQIQHQLNSGGTSLAVDTVTQTGANAAQLQWTVNWTTVSLYGSPLYYYCTELDKCLDNDMGGIYTPLNQTVVSSVVLPAPADGSTQQYSFTYSDNSVPGWGELRTVTLPSGATVKYDYSYDGHNKERFGYSLENPIEKKTVTWTDPVNASARQEVWQYAFGTCGVATCSTIQNPDGGTAQNLFGDPHIPGALSGVVYKITQPDGSVVERVWQNNRPYGSWGADPANPYVKYEFRTLSGGGSAVSASTYDKNGNQKIIAQYGSPAASGYYDWIPSNSISHDASFSCASCSIRTTTNSYALPTTNAGSGSETISDEVNAYWHPGTTSSGVRSQLTRSVVAGSEATAGPGSVDEYTYGDSYGHPNVITAEHWDSTLASSQPSSLTSSNSVVVSYSYDQYGNRSSETNGRQITTSFTYDSNNCMTPKVVASGTADARTFNYTCEASLGLVASETDADHGITRSFEYDNFGRNTLVTESGGSAVRKRKTTYYDGSLQIKEESDLSSAGDGSIVQTTFYDQLGQFWKTVDGLGNTVVSRHYTPSSGQAGYGYSYRLVSNPYVTQTEPSMGWTQTTLDTSGRVANVQYYSGSEPPSPWGSGTTSTGQVQNTYSTNTTTVTDEAGKSWSSSVDALGRLVQLKENGISATTTYQYDALDNLVGVTHPNGASRTFSYSSLKRLTSASNPEHATTGNSSGTISYTYDGNGNIHTRTNGSGITATYTYNNLDQLTAKTYSDTGATTPTPSASYTYDKGWRTSASSGTAQYTYTAFDGLGRATDGTQQTNGKQYTFHSTYNLAGGVLSTTMPSGRVVTTAYDSAGRPQAIGISGNSGLYASSITYAPHGAMQQMTLGNALIEQRCYNSRLQPFVIRQRKTGAVDCGNTSVMTPDSNDVAHLAYSYVSPNNGNLSGQTITYGASSSYVSKAFQQTYTYDSVNRLLTAKETGPGNTWEQGFGYDLVGNRWLSASSGDPSVGSFVPTAWSAFNSSNQLTIQSAGYTGGNQTQMGGYTFQYDGEDRLISSTMGGVQYSYDADGRRVMKQASGAATVYVYDLQGQLAGEYTTGGTGSASPCTTCYVMTDHLGSTRMITDGSGSQQLIYDYQPFGEQLGTGVNGRDARWGGAGNGVLFTGQVRDGETGGNSGTPTGLDHFGARYFSGAQGRFTSPDEPLAFADPENPQSWNLYAYGFSNPLLYSDPDGHEPCVEGVNPVNGHICTVVTAPKPSDPPDLTWFDKMLLRSLVATVQVAQQTQQVVQPVIDWLGSRDPACAMRGMAQGGAIGMAGGAALGLAGGPAAELTVPAFSLAGSVGGAGIGGAIGLATCASSAGQGGGGGESGSERGPKLGAPRNLPRGTRPIDRSGLSREAIHQIKRSIGAGAGDWVGVTREGRIVMNDGAGNAEVFGHWTDLTHYR